MDERARKPKGEERIVSGALAQRIAAEDAQAAHADYECIVAEARHEARNVGKQDPAAAGLRGRRGAKGRGKDRHTQQNMRRRIHVICGQDSELAHAQQD